MNVKDLKVDEYYCIDEGINFYILKFEKLEGRTIVATNIKTRSNTHFYVGGYFGSYKEENIRPATSLERQWLDNCIKAGKWIPKPIEELELLNFVEIY